MKQRIQRTPFGEVTLNSRWMRDRYYLVASGAEAALKWMLPDLSPQPNGPRFRVHFPPAPKPITVERELRRIASKWQEKWDDRLFDLEDVKELTDHPRIATLGDLFSIHAEERSKFISKSTASRDVYRRNLWIAELGNSTPLESLSAVAIQHAMRRMGKRISPSTVNPALGVLKTYLNWAVNAGHMCSIDFRNVRPLQNTSQRKSQKDWWTASEVTRAIEIASKDHHQPTATLLVACGCYLGLRVGELVWLRWEDLDLDLANPISGELQPICRINAHDGWKPKTGEARDIPIPKVLVAILNQHRSGNGYLLKRVEGSLAREGRPRGGNALGYRYDPRSTWERVMKEVEKCGGRRITMYGMRHSYASNLLIAGKSDVKVARWMGHSDTRMVHRHYGHLLSYDDDVNAITGKDS